MLYNVNEMMIETKKERLVFTKNPTQTSAQIRALNFTDLLTSYLLLMYVCMQCIILNWYLIDFCIIFKLSKVLINTIQWYISTGAKSHRKKMTEKE